MVRVCALICLIKSYSRQCGSIFHVINLSHSLHLSKRFLNKATTKLTLGECYRQRRCEQSIEWLTHSCGQLKMKQFCFSSVFMLFPCSQNMTHSLGWKVVNQALTISWYFRNGTQCNCTMIFKASCSSLVALAVGFASVKTEICRGRRSRFTSTLDSIKFNFHCSTGFVFGLPAHCLDKNKIQPFST